MNTRSKKMVPLMFVVSVVVIFVVLGIFVPQFTKVTEQVFLLIGGTIKLLVGAVLLFAVSPVITYVIVRLVFGGHIYNRPTDEIGVGWYVVGFVALGVGVVAGTTFAMVVSHLPVVDFVLVSFSLPEVGSEVVPTWLLLVNCVTSVFPVLLPVTPKLFGDADF